MNSIIAANRSHLPPVSNERRLLIAKQGDGIDILYDEAGKRRELNGVPVITIGSYADFDAITGYSGVNYDNITGHPGNLSPHGIYRFVFPEKNESGFLMVSVTGKKMIQRLFKGDCSILRRNGTSWGEHRWWEAWYPETEPDYSTGSEVTSQRWIDGKPVHVQTFIIPSIPNGGEYDTILIDICESVIEINGTTEIDEKRKSIHSSGIEVWFCDNNALKVTNNTGGEMQNTVITVKSATRMYSPNNPYAE